MTEENKNSLPVLGITQVDSRIGSVVKAMNSSKDIYNFSSVVKSIVGTIQPLFTENEFLKSIQRIQRFRNSLVHQLADTHSDLSRTFDAVSQFRSAINESLFRPNAELSSALHSIGKIGVAWNASAPRVMTSLIKHHYEFYELVRSGEITADQVIAGLDEALSRNITLDDNHGLVSETQRSSAVGELVNAFMSVGSLKGVSLPALQFFIALMFSLVWTLAAINQGFELQKNIGEQFTSAKTPGEARALSRHVPPGVEKEKLSGFRVLVGDRVSLREGPGQRYLSTKQLPIGSLLQVLDASEKSWLMVSVVEDGEIYEGWVLRGYTKTIRR